MAVHLVEEAFERNAVVQVLARMDLVAAVDARVLEHVEDRPPTRREFLEAGIHQTRRALRPRVHHGPQQRARERDVRREAQVGAGLRRELALLDGPLGAFRRLAVKFGGREAVEEAVVGGMHGDQLAFEVGRQLRDLHAALAHAPG